MEKLPLGRAFTLIEPGPVVLVTTREGERDNVMAISWTLVLDFTARFALTTGAWNYSYAALQKTRECVLAIPAADQLDTVIGVGTCSGRNTDKFARFGIATEKAEIVAAPLIAGCAGWLECKVIPEPRNQQTYDLFLAEVVAAWADASVFSDGRWHFADDAQRTIHYRAGGHFFVTGEGFSV